MSIGNVLAADDDPVIRGIVSRFGEKSGFSVETVGDGEQLLASVNEETDLILLDLNMPERDGFQCLEVLKKKHPDIPAIVLSGMDGASEAVRAMKLGAVDYLTKPFAPDELTAVLKNALRLRNTLKENEGLRDTLSSSATVSLIAESEQMKKVMRMVGKVSKLPTTVLLTGESGVGKGMIARQIHELGDPEGKKPFVTVSCPAIPRELLESELFGHEKGAFTGALKKRMGRFELANGGTLFLDEIGELSLELQSKLLNVLQEREFMRVGGNETIKLEARLITATNINFQEKIKEGSFREDLYYRLNVVPILIPPLRERRDELEVLCDFLLSKIAKNQGKKTLVLSREALLMVKKCPWPGNVRQLENELERAAVFSENGVIQVADLSAGLYSQELKGGVSIAGMTLQEIEKKAILETLILTDGNKKDAAKVLGIAEKSIYNKMVKLGI